MRYILLFMLLLMPFRVEASNFYDDSVEHWDAQEEDEERVPFLLDGNVKDLQCYYTHALVLVKNGNVEEAKKIGKKWARNRLAFIYGTYNEIYAQMEMLQVTKNEYIQLQNHEWRHVHTYYEPIGDPNNPIAVKVEVYGMVPFYANKLEAYEQRMSKYEQFGAIKNDEYYYEKIFSLESKSFLKQIKASLSM